MSRGLSNNFMTELKPNGKYYPIVEEVKKDHTLHFQIRENYINIYYRGCSILKLDDAGVIEIAAKYCKTNIINVSAWLKELPFIKQNVDYYLSVNDKSEREFQQVVARENSFSKVSNDTDYFIVDIEFADNENNCRFDMIAIKWLSKGADRKVDTNCRLAIIEMKYGIKAFDNLQKHFHDIDMYNKIDELKETTIKQFKQLRELDLIQFSSSGNTNEVTKLEVEVEFILLFANYKSASNEIKNNLSFMKTMEQTLKAKNIEVRFATSNFMGYGLYDNAMLPLSEFQNYI